MNAKFKSELSVAMAPDNQRIVITQKRKHHKIDGTRNYVVSLTRDEAKAVREQLGRQLALLETLDAQEEWLKARESSR